MSGVLHRLGQISALAMLAALGGVASAADEPSASIALGQSVQGSLDKSDSSLGSGELTDTYLFHGRAGQRVTIRLRSGISIPTS